MAGRRTGTPVGPLLDALGVRIALDESQQLVEVLVIGKVVDFQADRRVATSLVIGASDGLDWIAQRGLVSASADILTADILRGSED